MLIAIVNWAKGKNSYEAPKVCGPKGQRVSNYLHMYWEGTMPPHFPVPAIRQHFEFGWSLTDRKPVLFHVVQRTYGEWI